MTSDLDWLVKILQEWEKMPEDLTGVLIFYECNYHAAMIKEEFGEVYDVEVLQGPLEAVKQIKMKSKKIQL